MRASRMFTAANRSNARAAHGKRLGEAIPTPAATPKSQSELSIVAGSSDP